MPELSVRPVDTADRPLLERLWLMFRHDMSEFRCSLPFPDGTFRSERLHAPTGPGATSPAARRMDLLRGIGHAVLTVIPGQADSREESEPADYFRGCLTIYAVPFGQVGLERERELLSRSGHVIGA
jgi:hypothetical protein